MLKKVFIPIALTILAFSSIKAEEVTVTDATINAGQTYNMTSNNTYILDGFVFVEDGAVLNIEAGTVIKAKQGEGESASALVIAKGGKINANGTKAKPIIFTSELDDVTDAEDLPIGRAGLWGGLIILGKSTINTPGGTEQIEGIPSNEPRGSYGGNIEDDNSGTLKYVSIRHGGTNIGANNEINGLTLGGVGSKTTIDYVEVYANSDDGVEFFGGTVNTKHMAIVMCEDDSFDWDEGYRGNGQFWFSIQSPTTGNNMGENDGATDPEDSQPYAMPMVYNATYIGSGLSTARTSSRGFHIRDNSGAYYKNCIITDLGGAGLEIEDLTDEAAEDSRKRLETNEIQITNNLWWNVGDNTLNGIAPDVEGSKPYSQDFVRTYLGANKNMIQDPMLAGISRTTDGGLDPRPNDGIAWTAERAAIPSGSSFFTDVNYIGAFGEENWLEGWTFLSQAGFLGNLVQLSVERDETVSNNELYAYPNPVESNVTIELNITNNSLVNLELYNSIGNKVVNLDNTYLSTGKYSMDYNVESLSAGAYFIVLTTDYGTFTYQVIVK